MLSRTLVAITLALTLFSSADVSAQTPVSQADINRAKAEIELLKQDIEIRQAELRLMELQLARQSASPAPKPASKPAAMATTPVPAVAPSPAFAATAPTLPPKRADVDPAPYEKSSVGRVPQFRTTQSSKWLVLDEKRVVFWVLNEEAYLLNLAQTCPGLLDAEKIKLESFSTKVRAGHDGIVFSGQRCLIESITKLGGKNLPKPPKK